MSGLDDLFKKVNKDYGDTIAKTGLINRVYDLVSFGSLGVDYCTYGGWPIGRLIELFGPEQSGKTTSAIKMCSEYQKRPDAKEIVWVDVEGTFDIEWANKHGLDVTKIRMIEPDGLSAEQTLDIICQVVDTGEVGLVVIDSVAVLVPGIQLDGSMEKGNIGGVAKVLTLFCAKIIPLLKKNATACIAINQVRDDMDSMYNAYTTPGGKAFKHACSLRIECRMGDKFNMNNEVISKTAENAYGHLVKFVVRKTKVCPPDRLMGMYTLVYSKGVDDFQDTIRMGILFDVVQQSGAMYTIINTDTGEILTNEAGEPLKFRGKNGVYDYYREHKEDYEKLKAIVLQKIKEKQ